MARKNNTNIALYEELGKIPPQNIEMEAAILGCILYDKECMVEVMDIIKPESFYKDEYRKIYTVIFEMYDKDKAIDIMTVSNELRNKGQLDEVGGEYFITTLTGPINAREVSHVSDYAKLVQQKFIQREVIRQSNSSLAKAYDDSMDVDDLLDAYNKGIDEVNDLVKTKNSSRHINRVIKEVIVELKNRTQLVKDGKTVGLPTPLKGLDKKTFGWRNGNMIIIAARPGSGKTQVALRIAKTIALSKKVVRIYSLEMTSLSLVLRILCAEAGFSDEETFKVSGGYISDEMWAKINKAEKVLERLPIYIDDSSNVSLRHIKADARKARKANLCDAIVIDYLQLIDTSDDQKLVREQQVAKLSKGIKSLAKDLNVPIFLLCQLNRDVEKRHDKKPMLSDLRESGSIEQDPDMVIFLHRPEMYHLNEDEHGESLKGKLIFIIAKHRDGPTGEVRADCNKSLTRIEDSMRRTKPIDEETPAVEEANIFTPGEETDEVPF